MSHGSTLLAVKDRRFVFSITGEPGLLVSQTAQERSPRSGTQGTSSRDAPL